MKYNKFKRIKNQRRKIAIERIRILEEMIEKKPEFADRYRELIKRLKQKYRLQKIFKDRNNIRKR